MGLSQVYSPQFLHVNPSLEGGRHLRHRHWRDRDRRHLITHSQAPNRGHKIPNDDEGSFQPRPTTTSETVPASLTFARVRSRSSLISGKVWGTQRWASPAAKLRRLDDNDNSSGTNRMGIVVGWEARSRSTW